MHTHAFGFANMSQSQFQIPDRDDTASFPEGIDHGCIECLALVELSIEFTWDEVDVTFPIEEETALVAESFTFKAESYPQTIEVNVGGDRLATDDICVMQELLLEIDVTQSDHEIRVAYF